MEITYYGAGSVLIAVKKTQILIDPPGEGYKLNLPKIKPDITLSTQADDTSLKKDNGFKISSPGEYEIGGVLIQGIPAQLHVDKKEDPQKGIIYTLTIDGIHVLITGNIAPQLSEKQLESIGDVDVLVIPVGGAGLTLDANGAAKLVSQLEPSYVVPIHYNDGKATYPVPQEPVEKFLKEVGSEKAAVLPKLKITPKDIGEDTKIIVLKPAA